MSGKTIDRLIMAAVVIVPFIVYLLTMAATVSFWDSGEFIATSYILGIPHSPGTPLYVLVGRVFTMLPLPLSTAERVNFLSVVFSALGALMVYLIIVATARFMYPALKGGIGRFVVAAGGVAGAFYLAFSTTYWWDGTEAEVYALATFVMGLCTWLALVWYRNPAGHALDAPGSASRETGGRGQAERAIDAAEREERAWSRGLVYLILYLLALGIGFHLGTVLVFGGIFLLFLMVREKSFSNAELVIFTFGFAVLLADMTMYKASGVTLAGLAIFAILVAWATRARGKFTLAATGVLLLGISVHLYLYIRSHLDPGIDMVDPETWKAMYAHLRREQYPPMNIFARKASIAFQVAHFGRYFRDQFQMIGDHRLGIFNLGQALTAIPVALGFLGIAANFARERRTWVLNVFNLAVNSVGLVLFLNFSDHEVRERDYFYGPAFYFFAVFIGIGVTWLLVQIGAWARERRGRERSWVIPVGALCIALSLLPVRHNWFTHDRSRHVFARDYGRNMLASLEPDAILFTYGDNDTYPLWYLQQVERFRTDVRIANLSLLHTDWYIKQLRDREPKVPIAMTDLEIERLQPIALKGGDIAWRNDLMVQHIINQANWKRPIYFTTGVAPEEWLPYGDYLEMEGLVRRLVPTQGRNQVNAALLERNLAETFDYHGIVTKDWKPDTSIYRERDFRFVLNNYGIAMLELAGVKASARDFAAAATWVERALLFEDDLRPGKELLGTYYALGGDLERGLAYYDALTRREPGVGEYWLRWARLYTVDDRTPVALQKIDEGIARAPGFRQLYVEGFQLAARAGMAEPARRYVQSWLEKHPDDGEFSATLRDFDRVLEEARSLPSDDKPAR